MRTFIFVLLFLATRIAFSQPIPSTQLLTQAIEQGDATTLQELCTEGQSLQKQRFGRKLQSAIHVAASAHQHQILELLVTDCGLDPSELDATRTPALYYARMSSVTVETLLHLGADPNQMVKAEPLPIISQFLMNVVPRQSLEAFLTHGVDLTLKSKVGMTPLMYAVRTKRPENIEFLITAMKQGHDIAPEEVFNGRTAADIAVPYIAELLAEHGIE